MLDHYMRYANGLLAPEVMTIADIIVTVVNVREFYPMVQEIQNE
jgi:hypothetical protein